MKHAILKEGVKYTKEEFQKESELTQLFSKDYQSIISENSLFIKLEKKFKSKKFRNFKHSIGDR